MIALLRAVAGLIGWAVAFSALYALQGASCALGWNDVQPLGISAARIVLIGAYALCIGALAWLCWQLRSQSGSTDFLARLAFVSAIIGLCSTIYTGMPVLTTTLCN